MALFRLVAALGAAAFAMAAVPAGAAEPQPKLPTVPITAGFQVIQAEVARTAEQQMTGMMFRRSMGANEGMLFVNESAGVRCFWMRDTYVPLSIAFVADDGTIVNIADMEPRSERSHCSKAPVRFALEVNQGWFARRGIGPGFRLKGAPFTP
jgi:uncharacterized membrane protein (UPF0127 family)